MTDYVDCLVIGAGVVGLAIARALAKSGREVVVIEAQSTIGMGNSSRNSEVIHAGIYYPPGSLKAGLCVRGKSMLYQYCAERHIDHKRCGKMIVATDHEQATRLQGLFDQANENGVLDLQWLNRDEANLMEPVVRCAAGLFSPSTGIVDSHGLMLSLLGEIEENAGMVAFDTRVHSISVTPQGLVLKMNHGDENACEITAGTVINAAGLGAVGIAQRTDGLEPKFVPRQKLAKGNYFRLNSKPPVSRLIYPMPVVGGLGVHITLDLAGRVRFGPDVEWLDSIDSGHANSGQAGSGQVDSEWADADLMDASVYHVDDARVDSFYHSIRRYYPGLPDHSLSADYAGIRPKVEVNGEIFNDFLVSGPGEHGVTGLVNLFGIESPGLTSCLALADHVVSLGA